MKVVFPNIRPSDRAYKPGQYPQTFFQSINGATSVIQVGAPELTAELTLQFNNIGDSDTSGRISPYGSANRVRDYV